MGIHGRHKKGPTPAVPGRTPSVPLCDADVASFDVLAILPELVVNHCYRICSGDIPSLRNTADLGPA